MKLRAMCLALAWSASAAACVATETGNPVSESRLSLVGRSTVDGVSLSSTNAAGVNVDTAWVVLGDVRFVQSARCDRGDDQEADIEGPRVVELLSQPESLSFAVEGNEFCRVRVKLDKAKSVPASAPVALEDSALLIQGETVDGVRFTVASRKTHDVDVRSRTEPFEISAARSSLILAFDVGRWLSGIDWASAEIDVDGEIHIDDERNRESLNVFEANVEAAMELFDDADKNGALSDTEAADVLAAGGS